MLGMGKRIAFEKTKNVGLRFPFFQGRVQTMMNLPYTWLFFFLTSRSLQHLSVRHYYINLLKRTWTAWNRVSTALEIHGCYKNSSL